MDGVLIDSEPLHFEVDQMVLRKLNINESKSYLERFVGYTNCAMWQIIQNEYSIEKTIDELIELQMTTKLHFLEKSDYKAIDGIKELLEEIRLNKIPMGIASSSPRVFIEAVINKIGISQYFDNWISGEEVEKSKPEPDVFLKISELLGVNPDKCIVIEDSKSGTIAAKKAGMKCIGYKNINSGNQDLSIADLIIDRIPEINVHTMKELMR
ncbi:MAG: phosphatase [Spirochaetes bacterium GWF1_31_7]|nr:MAG: phosphatase [Spirochaetes bacterium GWE1_32_154]OHD44695.1 MAG: phosphatase [Spirochaetes bacterium GWE2_31_10]OHD47066.1 MAG: phosphatase [Spirochaetes bacterium GWF1_31_7]OHD83338.1 MAG: phosphatase [Spirochaetes bacterium RIFOXYB1_FULL_32_8]